jgi:hypothetical protein
MAEVRSFAGTAQGGEKPTQNPNDTPSKTQQFNKAKESAIQS